MKHSKILPWILLAVSLFALSYLVTNLYRQNQRQKIQDQSRPALPSTK